MNEVALFCNEILKWNPDVVITEKVKCLIFIILGSLRLSLTLPSSSKCFSDQKSQKD